MNHKKQIVSIIALVAVLVVIAFFYNRSSNVREEVGAEDSSVGAETETSLFAPEAENPFEENANPYKNIKTNPFE